MFSESGQGTLPTVHFESEYHLTVSAQTLQRSKQGLDYQSEFIT